MTPALSSREIVLVKFGSNPESHDISLYTSNIISTWNSHYSPLQLDTQTGAPVAAFWMEENGDSNHITLISWLVGPPFMILSTPSMDTSLLVHSFFCLTQTCYNKSSVQWVKENTVPVRRVSFNKVSRKRAKYFWFQVSNQLGLVIQQFLPFGFNKLGFPWLWKAKACESYSCKKTS